MGTSIVNITPNHLIDLGGQDKENISRLSFCLDALGNADFIPEAKDLEAAKSKLDLLAIPSSSLTWDAVEQALIKKYFDSPKWIEDAPHSSQKEIRTVWNQIKKDVTNKNVYRHQYQAAFMWLADQLRCLSDGIVVTPQSAPNGVDEGQVYFLTYTKPATFSQSTPAVVILPGDGTNPYFYSKMAMREAKEGQMVVVLDHPSGYFSSGYGTKDGKRTHVIGDTGNHPYMEAMARVLDSALKKSEVITDGGEGHPFILVGHSCGFYQRLAWQKRHEKDHPGQLLGAIDMAPGYGLAQVPLELPQVPHFLSLSNEGYAGLDFFGINVSFNGATTKTLTQAAGGDTKIAQAIQPAWYATRPAFTGKHYHAEYLFGKKKGPYAEDVQGFKSTVPYTVFFDPLNDPYTDAAKGVERLFDYVTDSASVKLVLMGTAENPIDETEKQKRYLTKLRQTLHNYAGHATTEWIAAKGGGHFMNVSDSTLNAFDAEIDRLVPPSP